MAILFTAVYRDLILGQPHRSPGRRMRLPYKFTERDLLCAFFKRGGFTAQVRQNFAGEMQ